MAISTRAQDYRESNAGIGSGSGGWPDAGPADETALTSPADRDTFDSNSSLTQDNLPATQEISESPETSVVIPDTPVQAVTEELGGVAVDTVKLLELQFQLFENECKQSVQRLIQPLLISATGLICGGVSLILLFHAMAWALHDLFAMPISLSLFIVTAIGAILTAVALKVAWTQLHKPNISFANSKAEFMRNVACFTSYVQPPRR